LRRPWVGFDAFHAFHEMQLNSWDVDPVYPVLKHILAGASPAQRIWAGLLHVAYYDLGSALAVYAACPTPQVPPAAMLKYPCGTERRAHRDPRVLARHLAALTDLHRLHGGLYNWLAEAVPYGYQGAAQTLTSVWGNGRWATYKACELLAHLMTPVKPAWRAFLPTDMGHANSSGPRHGLELLLPGQPTGNTAAAIDHLDAVSLDLCADLADHGTPAPPPTVETSLCDYHALTTGRYYPGHDIDQMQTQLDRTPSALTAAAYTARAATIPKTYLGEVNGWHGTDPLLRREYARTGILTTRMEHAHGPH
jgi:amino acid-DNA transferase-like protein